MRSFTIYPTDYNHNMYVMLNGKEYRVHSKKITEDESKTIVYDYSKDYSQIIQNPWIDGIIADNWKVVLKKDLHKMYGCDNFHAFHIVRQSEVEAFYEYTSSLIIYGIECKRFFDAGIGYVGYKELYPEFIEIEDDSYVEICKSIPEKNLKKIRIGNDPAHDGLYSTNLIPKDCIDKIVLHRIYLKSDLIENNLEKIYTGNQEDIVLDMQNVDSSILQIMIDHNVIKINDCCCR